MGSDRIDPEEVDRGMIEDSRLQRNFARPIGPGAGVVKYDVLTALSVMALHHSPVMQTTVLRLIALITARYNWKQDQFCVPQADMARLWNVSERTVKREMRRMVDGGLLRCIRQGVRGRVGAYRLNYDHLYDESRASWAAVGPDFEDRMQTRVAEADAKVVKVNFAAPRAPEALPAPDDLWGQVLHDLAETDAANLRNWYMKLSLEAVDGQHMTLRAPSGFVAGYVQTHLTPALTGAVARALGRSVRLVIVF